MKISPTKIAGVFTIEIEPFRDHRGFFARLQCPTEMMAASIAFKPKQTSLSRNAAAGTLRGMHYATVAEAKLIRCVRGRIFDVAVDLRSGSPTLHQWVSVELDAERANAMFIPHGVAHGFLTLAPDSDVLYQMDRLYAAGFDAGVRWNDPAFNITWPASPRVIAPRDQAFALYNLGP